MAEPLDPRFERDRLAKGDDYYLVDFKAERKKLDELLKQPNQTWQAGYFPWEDLAA